MPYTTSKKPPKPSKPLKQKSAPSGQGLFSARAQSVIQKLRSGTPIVWFRPFPDGRRFPFVLPPEGIIQSSFPNEEKKCYALVSWRGKLWFAVAEIHCKNPDLRFQLIAWNGEDGGRITFGSESMVRAYSTATNVLF